MRKYILIGMMLVVPSIVLAAPKRQKMVEVAKAITVDDSYEAVIEKTKSLGKPAGTQWLDGNPSAIWFSEKRECIMMVIVGHRSNSIDVECTGKPDAWGLGRTEVVYENTPLSRSRAKR